MKKDIFGGLDGLKQQSKIVRKSIISTIRKDF